MISAHNLQELRMRRYWSPTIKFGYSFLMRILIATLTALMLLAATPVVAGDYEDGLAAYDGGDYQKAFRLWKPLAEQEHANAQFNLGAKYAEGYGVPEDHAKAAPQIAVEKKA